MWVGLWVYNDPNMTTIDVSLHYSYKTSVLFVMYVSAVGYSMVFAGINIGQLEDVKEQYGDAIYDEYLKDYEIANSLLFAGGFLTTLFMVWHAEYYNYYTYYYIPQYIVILLLINILYTCIIHIYMYNTCTHNTI